MELSPKLAALSADWLTGVLRDGGHAEAPVSELTVEPVAFTGATTDMGRLRMPIELDAGAIGPESLIAKIRGTRTSRFRWTRRWGCSTARRVLWDLRRRGTGVDPPLLSHRRWRHVPAAAGGPREDADRRSDGGDHRADAEA